MIYGAVKRQSRKQCRTLTFDAEITTSSCFNNVVRDVSYNDSSKSMPVLLKDVPTSEKMHFKYILVLRP